MLKSISTGTGKTTELISEDLLLASGAALKTYQPGEYIFHEGDCPRFYHQVSEGKVKLVNITDDGKEFIQGFFFEGQPFGDPPLFDGGVYSSSAVADDKAVIIRLHISTFMQLLKDNFEIHFAMSKLLAKRLRNKGNRLKELLTFTPEEKIISILDKFKEEQFPELHRKEKAKIGFTRQEIADMSGMRVETVIRAMRNLHDSNKIFIEHGKVFY